MTLYFTFRWMQWLVIFNFILMTVFLISVLFVGVIGSLEFTVDSHFSVFSVISLIMLSAEWHVVLPIEVSMLR